MGALAAPLPRIVAIEIRGVRRDVPDEASLLRWIVQGEARAEDVCVDVTGQRVAVGERVDLEDFLEAARLLGRSAAPELTPEPPAPEGVAAAPVVAPSVAPALASLIDMSFDARDAGDDVDRPTVVVPADLVVPPRVPARPTVRPPRPSAPVVPSLVDMSFDTGRFGEGERPTVVVPDGPPPAALPPAPQVPSAEELAWLEAGDRDETETPWAEDEPVAAPAPTSKPAPGSARVVGVAVAAMLAALGVGVGWTLLRHRAEPEELPAEAPDVATAAPVEPAGAPSAPAVEPDPRPAPVATGSAATASAGTRAVAAPSVQPPAPRPVAPTRPVARTAPPPVAKPVAAPPPPPPSNPWATATPAPAAPARDAASVIAEGWTTAESGHFVAARSLFTEAIGLGGGAAAYYGRGYAAGKLGDTVAAGDDYCRALAANPPANQRSELNALLRKLGRSCG